MVNPEKETAGNVTSGPEKYDQDNSEKRPSLKNDISEQEKERNGTNLKRKREQT